MSSLHLHQARRRSSFTLLAGSGSALWRRRPPANRETAHPVQHLGFAQKVQQDIEVSSVSPGKANEQRCCGSPFPGRFPPFADALQHIVGIGRALHRFQDLFEACWKGYPDGQDFALGHQRDDVIHRRERVDSAGAPRRPACPALRTAPSCRVRTGRPCQKPVRYLMSTLQALVSATPPAVLWRRPDQRFGFQHFMHRPAVQVAAQTGMMQKVQR